MTSDRHRTARIDRRKVCKIAVPTLVTSSGGCLRLTSSGAETEAPSVTIENIDPPADPPNAGETVTVRLTLEYLGGAGSVRVVLMADGNEQASKTVQVNEDKRLTVAVPVTFDEAGTYDTVWQVRQDGAVQDETGPLTLPIGTPAK